jgi:hypothetical protein
MEIAIEDQVFNVPIANKHKYGEVTTDYTLIKAILDLIPSEAYMDPSKTWLDPCCGRGYFAIAIYNRLFKSLQPAFPNPLERRTHILSNMLFMIDINPTMEPILRNTFGKHANIMTSQDFLTTTKAFDVIVANPPFTVAGAVKVPTNKNLSKRFDGYAIWRSFVKHGIDCLSPKGYLAMITPCLWMKRDHPLFHEMLKWEILGVHSLSASETNKAFHGHAQTPTAYFCLQKVASLRSIPIFDESSKGYIPYPRSIPPNITTRSIPLSAISVLKKLHCYYGPYGTIAAIKTNMRPGYAGLTISLTKDENHSYPNVKTCLLKGLLPTLVINYTNKPCIGYKLPKLILAHKMYGFPYLDSLGTYGISNRDNYIISGYPLKHLELLKVFLSTKLARYLFASTRYRMRYLERYVFELIPNVVMAPTFPKLVNDGTLARFFGLSKVERLAIDRASKNYAECVVDVESV